MGESPHNRIKQFGTLRLWFRVQRYCYVSTKRYRAVILDDNSMILKVLWSFLDRLGYQVFAFPDPGLAPRLCAVQEATRYGAVC